MLTQLFAQARKLTTFVCLLYFLPLLFLIAVAVTSSRMEISTRLFVSDFAAVVDRHPLIGIASNLGVMLWTASATICLFTWAILRRRPGEVKFSAFLLCSGLMTLMLTADDFFLLHEKIFPRYLGLPEKLLFMGYGLLILWGLAAFKRCIFETDYFLLLVSFIFFGLALLIDTVQYQLDDLIGEWRILAEDGLKMLGIVGWFGYFLRCCSSRLQNRMS